MSALRVGGFVVAVISAIPVFILFRVCGNVRRELSEAGIREPELSLQMLSGLGGEPPREPRRLIGLSHAAIACSCGLA
jgi:hypothetical protein